VEAARGAFVGFLDADDLWVKEKLARQIAALDADRGLDMVLGLVRQFHSPELNAHPEARIASGETILAGSLGTLLIRRQSFLRVGPFTTKYRVGEFIDWFARASELGLKQITIPDVLLLRRVHTDNMTRVERHSTVDYVRILKAALDRRRTNGP
jgi:glycosyltransferase involved in cell wall biosynthesis